MSQSPRFLRLSRLPRLLLWLVTLLVIAFAMLGKPASWAAPVAHPPNQSVPSRQLTHLPVIASPLINACDFYLYACNLTVDFAYATSVHDWSPDGDTLAFYGAVDGAAGLYTMNEQGENRRLLFKSDPIDLVRYSPDGTMIALTARRGINIDGGGPYNIYGLYVYTLATGQVRLLSDTVIKDFSDVTPDWAPDSRTLAFARIQYGSTAETRDIYTIRPDGSELTQLTNTPVTEHLPIYSPDGTRIAYIAVNRESNNPAIAVMEANGDQPTTLTSAEALFANDPFWAADGNSIFFFGATENSMWDIYRINTDGGNLANLTHDALQQIAPVLSPDGSRILFVGLEESLEEGIREIDFYTMNLDGSNLTKYRNPHGTDRYPFAAKWHPDGRRISFAGLTDNFHLYLLRLGAGHAD